MIVVLVYFDDDEFGGDLLVKLDVVVCVGNLVIVV